MDRQIQAGVTLITGAGSGALDGPIQNLFQPYQRLTISKGIGQAIAAGFAREGCQKLFLVDLSHEALQRTQQIIEAECQSAKVILHITDISKSDQVQKMIQACVNTFGRLDFALNNAGIAIGGIKTADMSLEVFDKVCNVNEKGVSKE